VVLTKQVSSLKANLQSYLPGHRSGEFREIARTFQTAAADRHEVDSFLRLSGQLYTIGLSCAAEKTVKQEGKLRHAAEKTVKQEGTLRHSAEETSF
jgi:hypothetical protein